MFVLLSGIKLNLESESIRVGYSQPISAMLKFLTAGITSNLLEYSQPAEFKMAKITSYRKMVCKLSFYDEKSKPTIVYNPGLLLCWGKVTDL